MSARVIVIADAEDRNWQGADTVETSNSGVPWATVPLKQGDLALIRAMLNAMPWP